MLIPLTMLIFMNFESWKHAKCCDIFYLNDIDNLNKLFNPMLLVVCHPGRVKVIKYTKYN